MTSTGPGGAQSSPLYGSTPPSTTTAPGGLYSTAISQQQTQLSSQPMQQGLQQGNMQQGMMQQPGIMQQQGMQLGMQQQGGVHQQGMMQSQNMQQQQQQGMQMGMQQQGMQNQQSGMFSSTTRQPLKGIPAVVPVTGLGSTPSPASQQPPVSGAAPNLMQKFTEMTAPGGDILSKGKELIFMKFGLGGK